MTALEPAVIQTREAHFLNGETRIRDTDLASKLGYDRPTNIRTLIKRNLTALEAMGLVLQSEAPFSSGKGTVKTTTEYRLNQAQAAYLISKARTKEATNMAILIAEVFALFAGGHLAPTSLEADAAVADSISRYQERAEVRREHLEARSEAFRLLKHRTPRRRRALNAAIS